MNLFHKRYDNKRKKSYEWYLEWLRKKGYTKNVKHN